MKKQTRLMPRAPLTTDRRTGGAHRVRRELPAREDIALRLNEMREAIAYELAEIAEILDFDEDF